MNKIKHALMDQFGPAVPQFPVQKVERKYNKQ